MPLSIRWRLTQWNAAALAVLLLAFAGLVYGLLRHALYLQADRTLIAALDQLEQDPRLAVEPGGRLHHWIEEWEEHANLRAAVYDADGLVLERTEGLPTASTPPAQPAGGGRRFTDLDVPGLGRQRVLEARLALAGRPAAIRLMAPLAEVDRELGRLTAVLLTAVPVVLVLSAALGYALARKALALVGQLRRSAEGITADRLDRRLPIAHAGDELGRLAQTFNAVIGRLERSFAEIRRFTADASHELRTPLTAIRTEAEVALAQPLGPGECRLLLGSILEECDRLTRMTDQLLALAREDAGLARPQEATDLAAVARDAAETMRPLAEAKGLRLTVVAERPAVVRGDGGRLRQVFYNLLDNAIKYTPSGGQVEVRCGRQAGAIVATVRDSGVGIPPEHLPRVFDRFYRVDKARSREQGGTGLGLSIAQSIVTAHGGAIELASEQGRGTTPTITLPAGVPGPAEGSDGLHVPAKGGEA